MDIAENEVVGRALLAERFGDDVVPLDLKDGTESDGAPDLVAAEHARRRNFVGDLERMAAWITDHPEWPLPHSVQVVSMTSPELLEELSEKYGHKTFKMFNGSPCCMVDHPSESGRLMVLYAIDATDGPVL